MGVSAHDDARREAEEALATVAVRYPNGWGGYDTLSVCTTALRSVLASTFDLAERLAGAERERDEARANLAASREVYKMQVDACLRGTCNGARHPAPPADAAREAVLAPILGLRITAKEIRAALKSVMPYGPGRRDEAFVQTAAEAAALCLDVLEKR